MKKNIPIASDLFRFVTFRSPNHLLYDKKQDNYIFHPRLSKSLIASCPVPPNEGAQLSDVFETFLKHFRPAKKYEDIRGINPLLYDFSGLLFKYRSGSVPLVDSHNQAPVLTEEQLIKVWDNLFYQIMTHESSYVRQACIQLIVADNYLKKTRADAKVEPAALLHTIIVIPKEVLQCFMPWVYNQCDAKLNGINKLGIADFRKVEQEVCCYVPGEVSHIENVLAKEYKEKQTRNLLRTELTTELISEVEIENMNDTTTTTRNELNTEISRVLEEEHSANYGGSLGVSANYLGAQIDVNTYADFANSNASSYSNTNAQQYAQEVTRRALERIVRKTTEKRTYKIIKEFEEHNKHGFDNRAGENHVTGIYRWVDIIYTNRLVNYGKRLMYEFLVPEPATFYKIALNYKPKAGSGQNTPQIQPPKPLSDFGITKPGDITADNAAQAASAYSVQLDQTPELTQAVSQSFSPTPPIEHSGTPWTQQFNVAIPTDYEADHFSGNYSFQYRAWGLGSDAYFTFNIGGVTGGKTDLRAQEKTTYHDTMNGAFSPKHATAVNVLFNGVQLFSYNVYIVIICKIKASKWAEWQNNVYNHLVEAYNDLLEKYESEIEQSETQNGEPVEPVTGSSNPAFNRIIEQRELKRACIELLTKPFCRELGKSFYKSLLLCDYPIPQITQDKALEDYATQVKFFEQAFDWSVMSYLFYPYYWANPCNWAPLFQSAHEDAIFQAFLQSGMARVVVPVRPEFTNAVMYYLETGDIWLGGDLVVETDDDLYLSINEELQNPAGLVEGEWKTRVPTALTLVQNKSAKLVQEGLPCCPDLNTEETTTDILPSSEILQIINP